jgi:hypothetical protein
MATSSPGIPAVNWPYCRLTIDVVRPVTSTDRAWITPHAETMLSACLSGFGPKNALPRQNPASRNALGQLMGKRLLRPNPVLDPHLRRQQQ